MHPVLMCTLVVAPTPRVTSPSPPPPPPPPKKKKPKKKPQNNKLKQKKHHHHDPSSCLLHNCNVATQRACSNRNTRTRTLVDVTVMQAILR